MRLQIYVRAVTVASFEPTSDNPSTTDFVLETGMLNRWRGAGSLVRALGSLRLCERCRRALSISVTQLQRAYGDLKTDYEALVAAGELNFDPHQQESVEQLQRLQRQLAGYEPPPPPSLLGKVGIYMEFHLYVYSTVERPCNSKPSVKFDSRLLH